MHTKFASIQEIINSRVKTIFEKLNEGKGHTTPAFDFDDGCIEEKEEEEVEEAAMSAQFLQLQKNQFLELKQHLELYMNTLPVFGFNSGKYDLNLIKSPIYLISFMNGIFKLQFSKRRTILSPSKLGMCSSLTF